MKKKGFTLIELLSVIVILAVISIITIPLIGNVIEESRRKSLEVSVRGLLEAADYYAINNDGVEEFIFDGNNKGTTINGKKLDYSGNIEAEGKLYIDKNGEVSLCLMNEKYYVYKNYNSGIVLGNRNEDSCRVEYDTLTNKYIAFLESEGSSSNVYSKDEVDNLIDNVNTSITNNSNEITNVKSSIETLQTSLNDYALKSELDTTNSNLENISQIVSSNQSNISTNTNDIKSLQNRLGQYNFNWKTNTGKPNEVEIKLGTVAVASIPQNYDFTGIANSVSNLETNVNNLNNKDYVENMLFKTTGGSGYTGDVNDIKETGMYSEVISPAATNGPGYYAYLLVFGYTDSGNVTQVAFGYNVNKISIRFSYNGQWSEWTEK